MKRPIAWSVVPLVAVLWPLLATAAPSQPLVTKRALMASLNALPAAVVAAPHRVLRAISATQAEAEALFATSDAAVYLPDKGEVLSLVSGDPATTWNAVPDGVDARVTGGPSAESSAAPSVATVQSLGESTLAEFAALAEKTIAEAALAPGANYLVKFPSAMERPVAEGQVQATASSLPVTTLDTNYYLYQDFEGNVWSLWSRGDNTGGQYQWAVTNCAAHSGYYSANPVRGGTQGSYLGCSASYPPSVKTWMYAPLCQTIPADWAAWGSVYITGTIGTGTDDYLGFYATDQTGQHLYGYSFYGTWQGWFKITANLRQWYFLGDLGQYACNSFYMYFSSSANAPAGAGPSVDDIEFDVGPTATTTGQSQAIANPVIGQAPLTVSFRGVTDLTYGTFRWDFGDGSTSTALAPVHVYTTPGTYLVDFRATYGGVVGHADTTVTVQAGATCSYSLSAASQSFAAGSATGAVGVITAANCAWTANSNANWISITSGASGTGNGTVSYSVQANTGSTRIGTITIAGQTFTVTQAALTCSYSLAPQSANFLATGGTGSFTVTSSAGCLWSAAWQAAWISVTSGANGTGAGTVSYSVQANSSSARTGTITVGGQTFTVNQSAGGPSYAYLYWVPVASHVGGLNESQWRSDLGLLNTGSVTANVQLKFFGGSVVSTTTYVAPQAQSILNDIVDQLNASGSGPIEVLSDQPLKVTTRTYNLVSSGASCYPNGTQGQAYPVVASGDGLAAGQSAYLAGLTENASYRCNIGVVNTGTEGATVLVELFDGAGRNLASYTVSLATGQWVQPAQPFLNVAGQTAMDRGYARITAQTGSGVFAFASVIDNITNDPTPVTMQR